MEGWHARSGDILKPIPMFRKKLAIRWGAVVGKIKGFSLKGLELGLHRIVR